MPGGWVIIWNHNYNFKQNSGKVRHVHSVDIYKLGYDICYSMSRSLFLILQQVSTLTNEGGRLRRHPPISQNKDYEIIPDPVWKALALWYAGGPALPRNVSRSLFHQR